VTMSATPVMVSIGDTGVLNREVSHPLSEIWIDRDLGWLDFNDRVLAEALDQRTPLLERAKFLAIFTSNLDEFVMKRVSVLRHGTSPGRANLLAQIRERLVDSLRRQADCFRHQLVPELAAHGIHLRKWDDLTPAQQDAAGRYFDDEISPALTPLVFDPAHAFPFLSNLSISLAFLLHDPRKETSSYARVKIPAVLKQWIPVETDVPRGEHVFVPLYDVIRGNIHKLYAGMKLTGTSLFRLTRDADVEIEDYLFIGRPFEIRGGGPRAPRRPDQVAATFRGSICGARPIGTTSAASTGSEEYVGAANMRTEQRLKPGKAPCRKLHADEIP